MTQEQKSLLIKDLCARLPYRVKAQIKNEIVALDSICDDDGYHFNFISEDKEGVNIEEIKPYLFPLSSMTEEQKIDLTKHLNARVFVNGEISFQCLYANTMDRWEKVFKWCNKNHFDYRGLIPMGLANDATGLNIY